MFNDAEFLEKILVRPPAANTTAFVSMVMYEPVSISNPIAPFTILLSTIISIMLRPLARLILECLATSPRKVRDIAGPVLRKST